MRRKLFIAINLDGKTRKYISQKVDRLQSTLPDLDIHWTDPENYHLTLAFLGFTEDEHIPELFQKLRDALESVEMFDMSLTDFQWGPKPDRPKMVWLQGPSQPPLNELRHHVERALFGDEIEQSVFRPHLTLGRIHRRSGDVFPAPLAPQTNILIPVTSVDVMESVVEKGKRKYYVMESIELQ